MRTNKLSAAIFLIIAPWMAGQALADCKPTAATTPIDAGDDIVICNDADGGADIDGVDTGDGNDTITVVAGSSVSNVGAAAILAGSGANVVSNAGALVTTGDFAYGIAASGDDNVLSTEAGATIDTSGLGADGIQLLGDRTTAPDSVINRGSITTAGNDADGIAVGGNRHYLHNVGTIDTSGSADIIGSDATGGFPAGASGIEVKGDNNVVINSDPGLIATTGNNADAITAVGEGNTLANWGSITTSGLTSRGIRAVGNGNHSANYGSISTSGLEGDGLRTTGDLSELDNIGTINTSGQSASALRAIGTLNGLRNRAGAIITTGGANAHGMQATGNSNHLDQAGSLSTAGDNAIGVFAIGNGNRLVNSGTISTSGVAADGLVAIGDGNTIQHHDTILTGGIGARGIFVQGNGNLVAIWDATTITTSALGADGIALRGDGLGTTTADILTGGNVTASGSDADAISVVGDNHFVRHFAGTLTTNGGHDLGDTDAIGGRIYGSQGIEMVGEGNRVDVDAGANIVVTGDDADAIAMYGTGSILNAGFLDVQGQRSNGIEIGNGEGSIVNTGTIHTSGTQGFGVFLAGVDESHVLNEGVIETTGAGASGIYAFGGGHIIGNGVGGIIATSGTDSHGISVGYLFAAAIGDTAVNAGSITTSGLGSDGIRMYGAGPIINMGTIATSGDDADGIAASGESQVILNSGSITTSGTRDPAGFDSVSARPAGASGIEVSGLGHRVEVLEGGSITTAGAESSAVFARGSGHALSNAGTIGVLGDYSAGILTDGDLNTILNDGSIVTEGDFGYAMISVGDGNTMTNAAGGAITTSGGSAHGMFIIGNDNDAVNAGRIIAANGAGVVLQGGNNNTLDNSGWITASGVSAAIELGTGTTAAIDNSGLIESMAACVSGRGAGDTSVVSSGSMACGWLAVDLADGNDSVRLVDGSLTRGHISLGAGNDTVTLDVGAGLAGRLDGSIFAAESLHKDGAGLFTIVGSAEVGFTSAHVNAGTLQLFDGALIGNAYVHAGAALEAYRYGFRGNLDNAGSLLSGEGILEVSGDFSQSADGLVTMYSNVSGSESSRIEVGGTATLGGLVDVTVTDPANLLLGYNDILLVDAAGGRSGEFAGFSDNLAGSVPAELAYTANQAFLRVTLAPDSDAMLGFGTGTAQASRLVTSVMDQRLRLLNDSRRAVDKGEAGQAHNGPWLQYYGTKTEFDDDVREREFAVNTNGALAGIDFRPGDATALGAVVGYNDSATASSAAHGTTRGLQAGFYASHGLGRGYLEGIAMYSAQEYRIQRRTLFGDIAGSAHDGQAIGVRLAGGFEVRGGITVFDQVAYDHVDQDGYAESGAPGFEQAFGADSFESLRNRLGVRFSRFRTASDGTVAAPWVELAWEHDLALDEVQVASRPATAAGPLAVSMREPGKRNGLGARAGVSFLHKDTTFSVQAHLERHGDVEDWGASMQVGWLLD